MVACGIIDHKLTRRQFFTFTGGVLAAGALGSILTNSTPEANNMPLARLADRVRVGAYVHLLGEPYANPVSVIDLEKFESNFGKPLDVIHYYLDWGKSFASLLNDNVPARELMVSWKPTAAVMKSILHNSEDAYIKTFVTEAAAYEAPIYLRFAWEMNGSWMDYSGNPTEYIAVWRRLVASFSGAPNVQWIWCPNENDFPVVADNRLENYWPGAAWVDIIGFDAYNWSHQRPIRGDGTWRTFEEICISPYRRVTRLHGTMPVWLCEFGTTESGPGDPQGITKGDWFEAMFNSQEFPRLEALVYFSEDDTRDTQRDWRIDSSPGSIAGWSAGWYSTKPRPGGHTS